MTKKQEFLQDYQKAKESGEVIAVWLYIHMPGGETEVIINPNPEEKVAYIDRTYNDDLRHSNNEQIYIENYDFGTADDEDKMNFGDALECAKMGARITRAGWNGKGMYVFLATDTHFHTEADLSKFNPGRVEDCTEENKVEVSDMLVLRTAQGTLQPGWLASQSDMLAEDWYSLPDEREEGQKE